jgi:hypothetical protein
MNLTEAELTALRAMAEVVGLPWAELVRRAVDQYLAKPDVVWPHTKEAPDAHC